MEYNLIMCGRFALSFKNLKDLRTYFGLDNIVEDILPRYNIAPGQSSLVITASDNKRSGVSMKWGLVPSWAKDAKIGYKMINARLETLAEKPSFKRPLLSQRCLILASGFYEWKHEGKTKTPYYFHLEDRELFSFAGLFDIWHPDTEEGQLYTFTIITKEADSVMKQYHDRMPVIVNKDNEKRWIDPTMKDVTKLHQILQSSSSALIAYQISDRINTASFDDQGLLNPV